MQVVEREIKCKLEAVEPHRGKSLPKLKIGDTIKGSSFYKSLIGRSKSSIIPKIIAWRKALSDLSARKGAANADKGKSPHPSSPHQATAMMS